MTHTLVFENARVVLPEAVSEGWVAVAGEQIVEVGEGRRPSAASISAATCCAGIHRAAHRPPGEPPEAPPEGAWPSTAAVVAYDAQIAASGITTVFDSLRVGDDADRGSQARAREAS